MKGVNLLGVLGLLSVTFPDLPAKCLKPCINKCFFYSFCVDCITPNFTRCLAFYLVIAHHARQYYHQRMSWLLWHYHQSLPPLIRKETDQASQGNELHWLCLHVLRLTLWQTRRNATGSAQQHPGRVTTRITTKGNHKVSSMLLSIIPPICT